MSAPDTPPMRPLTAKHLADLRTSGLSDAQIAACGFYSITDATAIAKRLNWEHAARKLGDCLAIPFCDATGKPTGYVRLRPDQPRERDGKPVKYESPVGSTLRAYLPPGTRAHLRNPSAPLLITEGEKKAAKADQEGFPCIGLTGVDCFLKKRPKDESGKRIGEPELIDELQAIDLRGREVVIAYDSDIGRKPQVAAAEKRLAKALAAAGAVVKAIRIPAAPDGTKRGLDDFLVAAGKTALAALVAGAQPVETGETPALAFELRSAGELIETYPDLRPAVVDGLLREGETMNINAGTKARKSWIALDLALAITSGGKWLDRAVAKGSVLYIDNELHPETITQRIKAVAGARNLVHDDYYESLSVDSLRGRIVPLSQMAEAFAGLEPGRFKVIVLDAWYRFMEDDADENSNADATKMYNLLDAHAHRLGCSFAIIHHSSKGNQSGKSVTDIGAGAGAQARAADTHVAIRAHEEPDCAVFEAATRSWPRPTPFVLRWEYPLWNVAPDLDAGDLHGRKADEKPKAKDWPAENVADLVTAKPLGRQTLIEKIKAAAGVSATKARELIDLAVESEAVVMDQKGRNTKASYRLPSVCESDRTTPPHTDDPGSVCV